MESGFKIKLDVSNIGPHTGSNEIHFTDDVESNKAVFFAENGVGKSFISRTFRHLSRQNISYPSNDLISLGTQYGHVSFTVMSKGAVSSSTVAVRKGESVAITNDANYVFHVFNSDFVEENLRTNDFTPDGKIEGYILGKSNIDVSSEKAKLAKLTEKYDELNKIIKNEIEIAKGELKSAGVSSSTREYTLLSRDSILYYTKKDDFYSYSDVLLQLIKLKNMPEDIPAIPSIHILEWTLDSERVEYILKTKIPTSDLDSEFIESIKRSQPFFDSGLKILGEGNHCPFCGQELDTHAIELIAKYQNFLKGKEAALYSEIKNIIAEIQKVIVSIEDLPRLTALANAKLIILQQYFPSISDIELDKLDVGREEIVIFQNLVMELDHKTSDLEYIYDGICELEVACRNVIKIINTRIEKCNRLVQRANEQRENSANERLNLRKHLCLAQYARCHEKLRSTIDEVNAVKSEIELTKEDIRTKEMLTKREKKEAVYSTLVHYLDLFFLGKYLVDEETFKIIFGSNVLEKGAAHVLSDGEKSIVAFCYYLALTHLQVDNTMEYNRLFFLIDDPVSSMDYKYVFILSQIIRSLDKMFDITAQYYRIWIFTHNCDFFNLLARNHVLGRSCSFYHFKPGNISRFKQEFMLPYECHLYDLLNISNGGEPSHTTANSIRHVLETVNKFENPRRSLEKFIQEYDELAINPWIYCMCNDLSHGNVTGQASISKENLVQACKTVIQFLKSNYPGQLQSISAHIE